MPENDVVETTDTETETENQEQQETVEEPAEETQEDPTDKLQKALRSEREARKTAERERNALKQQLADKDKPAEEQALEAARREAEAAATAKANERIVRAELKAAAAGKVKRPDLLVKVTDVASIDVDENGDPDVDALNDAIERFLEDYPELAADTSKFTGSADQGSKGKQTQPRQLSHEDIKSMSPEQIIKAQEEGRLNGLLGRK